ncbi:MAG: transcription antitermination factor NusB [Vicinamibacterales bacterium]
MTTLQPGGARWEARHRAREAALRALYLITVGQVPRDAALDLVSPAASDDDGLALDPEARALADRLTTGTWDAREDLDALIAPHCVNWRIERLAVLDHLVLRLAVHEWLTEKATPPKVVLSEALELARVYSGDAAVRFVNGVLDAVYHRLRREGRIID